jgi:hypothetical protein
MWKKKSLYSIFASMLIVFTVFVYSQKAHALAADGQDIGLSIGLWNSGDIYLAEYDVDIEKKSSLLFRLFYDSYIVPKFAIGGYINYSQVDLSNGYVTASATMIEFGVAMKPRFLLGEKMAIKPGLNLGYRTTDSSDYESAEGEGLGVNLSVELQFLMNPKYNFHIEGGFLSQPIGGNDDTIILWAPITYILVGMVF